jgi:kynurenine formamidase
MMSRRALLSSVIGAAAVGRTRHDVDTALPSKTARLIDLTHTLSPDVPYIHVKDATFPFQREPIATIPARGVYANRWALTEHIGTHLDAPCHFAENAVCVSAIPLSQLCVEAAVIDLSTRAAGNPDTELTNEDLDSWIAMHGPLPARCAVLLRSGWGARWPSQARFANADDTGTMRFPGFSARCVERLAGASSVLGVGTDTFSIDPGRDIGYAGHKILAARGKWAVECLANLEQLPPRGATLLIGAIPVEAASGSPARVVAWVPT